MTRNSHSVAYLSNLAHLFLARQIGTLARQLYTAVMAKTKHRSPNYPRLAFDFALKKTRAIYTQQHKHSASRDVIAQALGYTTFNGASKAAITALKHYGLLEPAGDGLRVSADAIRVLELPQGDPEWTTAVVRMVFAPSVFADLRSKYGEPLPLSVRHVLVYAGLRAARGRRDHSRLPRKFRIRPRSRRRCWRAFRCGPSRTEIRSACRHS